MTTPLDRLRQVPTGRGRTAATWFGQAGFAVAAGGRMALIDPFLSPHEARRYDPSMTPSSASGVDLVLCTHEHLDHFDPAGAPAIAAASPGAVFVVPTPIVDQVAEVGIAPDRVLGVQPGDRHEVAGLRSMPSRRVTASRWTTRTGSARSCRAARSDSSAT